MQENWIGKSEGVRFAFTHDIKRRNRPSRSRTARLYVFTTRADTIMGVTFCAVAPEHPLATQAADGNPELAGLHRASASWAAPPRPSSPPAEKEGLPTGLTVTHPLTDEQVDVWVGNYVLMSYGDGAVMGVPATTSATSPSRASTSCRSARWSIVDGQDLLPPTPGRSGTPTSRAAAPVHSGKYNGLASKDGGGRHRAPTWRPRACGEKQTTWRLRDWGISRQRYWGTPIPIIHCDDCGPVPVPRERPARGAARGPACPDGTGQPAGQERSLPGLRVPRVRQAGAARDRHDGYLRRLVLVLHALYLARQRRRHGGEARNDYWMPMDQYIGGIEHARAAPAVRALLDQGHARPGHCSKVDEPLHAAAERRAWC